VQDVPARSFERCAALVQARDHSMGSPY
jgi:hypothetical protein